MTALANFLLPVIDPGSVQPEGAIVEIIERTDDPDPMVLVPNEVRIQGHKLLASADHPVTVHEVSTIGRDIVYVTLTLLAKRVTFTSEPTA